MKIGVFFSKSGREMAEHLLNELKSIRDVELHGYLIGKNWEDVDGQEMQYHLRQFDVFLIVTGECQRISDLGNWICMLLGYVMGRDATVCIFSKKTLGLQSMYKHLPVFSDEQEMIQFLQVEKQIWCQDKTILGARQRISDSGLGLNEETLANKVVKGDLSMVQDYIIVGFSPDARDPSGTPLLVLAIRNGHDNLARELIKMGAGVNVLSEDRGNTPLMEAAVRGSVVLIHELIKEGAELDVQSKNGQSALMLSVGEGHIPAALALIKAGANPEIVDQLGMTARKYAALFNHKSVLEALDQISLT